MHEDYHITMVTQLMDDLDTKEKYSVRFVAEV